MHENVHATPIKENSHNGKRIEKEETKAEKWRVANTIAIHPRAKILNTPPMVCIVRSPVHRYTATRGG